MNKTGFRCGGNSPLICSLYSGSVSVSYVYEIFIFSGNMLNEENSMFLEFRKVRTKYFYSIGYQVYTKVKTF